jgi:hypothetical protein
MSESMSAPPTYAAAAALPPAASANANANAATAATAAAAAAAAARKPHDPDLAAFWDIFKLGHRRELLNDYFGIETVEDLEDVLLGDLKTIAFAGWAERYLTIVDKNRLRRAVNHYQLQLRTAPDLYSSPVGVDSVPYALVHPAV